MASAAVNIVDVINKICSLNETNFSVDINGKTILASAYNQGTGFRLKIFDHFAEKIVCDYYHHMKCPLSYNTSMMKIFICGLLFSHNVITDEKLSDIYDEL